MNKAIIHQILDKYQLDYHEILESQKGYRNQSFPVRLASGQMVNLICFKRDPDILTKIKAADSLAKTAALSGLPIRTPYDKRIIKIATGKYAGLYNYLPGQTIPWEDYTKKHIKLLGWSLAAFHRATTNHTSPLPSASQIFKQIFKRAETYFDDQLVLSAIARKLNVEISFPFDSLDQLLKSCEQLSNQQPLHLDFVRGNVLFRRAKPDDTFTINDLALSGIIDLEKAAKGTVFFDIGRTLAFLLVDCPKPADKIYKYFIDSGYQKRGQTRLHPIKINDQDLLEQLINLFLIYDFYKFLKQNPYESLTDNYHYQGTSRLLIKRGLLVKSARNTEQT